MKAISLWQPWSSALFAPMNPGASMEAIKTYETRSWPMPSLLIGQEVAIQAAKRNTKDEQEFWMHVVMDTTRREIYGHSFAAIGIHNYSDLPRGAIIGKVKFARSVHVEDLDVLGEIEHDWGNYSAGRYAWPVTETNLFPAPIPCMGRQGFFDWTP